MWTAVDTAQRGVNEVKVLGTTYRQGAQQQRREWRQQREHCDLATRCSADAPAQRASDFKHSSALGPVCLYVVVQTGATKRAIKQYMAH